MTKKPTSIIVLYDGACKTCVNDRALYERWIGQGGQHIHWYDLNQHADLLLKHQIDYQHAIAELHLIINEQKIVKSIDAYIELFRYIWWLKPASWLLSVPLIKAKCEQKYHQKVRQRLKNSHRL